MANKLTTRDLIGSLIELQVDRDNQELMEPDNEASLIPIDKAIQEVKNQISRKP